MKIITILCEVIVLAFGVFLVLDSLFWTLLSFEYSALGLSWLDFYLDHWMIGMVFIGIGAYSLWRSTR